MSMWRTGVVPNMNRAGRSDGSRLTVGGHRRSGFFLGAIDARLTRVSGLWTRFVSLLVSYPLETQTPFLVPVVWVDEILLGTVIFCLKPGKSYFQGFLGDAGCRSSTVWFTKQGFTPFVHVRMKALKSAWSAACPFMLTRRLQSHQPDTCTIALCK